MSDFKILNGYNVKDSVSRNSIEYNLHLLGITTYKINEYSITQGGCIVDNDIIVYVQNKEDNDAVVRKMNIKTGNIYMSVNHNDLGHAQSLCYNKEANKIVITHYVDKKLIVIDGNTLLTISTIELSSDK